MMKSLTRKLRHRMRRPCNGLIIRLQELRSQTKKYVFCMRQLWVQWLLKKKNIDHAQWLKNIEVRFPCASIAVRKSLRRFDKNSNHSRPLKALLSDKEDTNVWQSVHLSLIGLYNVQFSEMSIISHVFRCAILKLILFTCCFTQWDSSIQSTDSIYANQVLPIYLCADGFYLCVVNWFSVNNLRTDFGEADKAVK